MKNCQNLFNWKVSAARALSSPSREAAEDNVEERENSEVKQFFGSGGITGYGLRVTDGQTDVEFEIVF